MIIIFIIRVIFLITILYNNTLHYEKLHFFELFGEVFDKQCRIDDELIKNGR